MAPLYHLTKYSVKTTSKSFLLFLFIDINMAFMFSYMELVYALHTQPNSYPFSINTFTLCEDPYNINAFLSGTKTRYTEIVC